MARNKAVQVTGVFDANDYRALRDARTSLNHLLGKLDKAKACGVDCGMYEQMRVDMDAQLAAIEQHFMTPPPTA